MINGAVLNGLQWSRAVLYLDDCIVYGKWFDETLQNLEEVLKRFRKANLKLKPSKCKLFQTTVEFLGHVVSAEGISCDPKKIEAVRDWTKPTNVSEIRSFVGFAQYYRKFIPGFSNIAAPLYELTKKRAKFIWCEKCEEAFNTLKSKLISAPVLAYPNREEEFILDTDCSAYAAGAVLSQIQNGEERPIAYSSKTLNKSQRNYCTTMRELLAVVIFIKQFHHYLWGRKFTLRTDHASLQWLTSFKEPSGMLARWMSILANYEMNIVHRQGKLHSNADSLSRIVRKCKREDCEDCALNTRDCICVITRSMSKKQAICEDNESSVVGESPMSSTACGSSSNGSGPVEQTQFEGERPSFVGESPTSSGVCEASSGISGPVAQAQFEGERPSVVGESPMSSGAEAMFSQNVQLESTEATSSSVDPPANIVDENTKEFKRCATPNWLGYWTREELKEYQEKDEILSQIIELKNARNDPPDKHMVDRSCTEMKALCIQWKFLVVQDGILYRRWIPLNPEDKECMQIVVPSKMRSEILHMLHNHKSAGHLGIAKTLGNFRQRFYWPGHKADIERWCTTCKVCESVNSKLNPKKAPLQQKFVYRKMDRIAVDIMGPVPTSSNGNSYILVVCDYFSKYSEAYPMPDMTAETVADVLSTEWISRYGAPVTIHSDQGRNFESELFHSLCELWDIHKSRTARYKPNSNGLVEKTKPNT